MRDLSKNITDSVRECVLPNLRCTSVCLGMYSEPRLFDVASRWSCRLVAPCLFSTLPRVTDGNSKCDWWRMHGQLILYLWIIVFMLFAGLLCYIFSYKKSTDFVRKPCNYSGNISSGAAKWKGRTISEVQSNAKVPSQKTCFVDLKGSYQYKPRKPKGVEDSEFVLLPTAHAICA